jgi:hypothetical protein
MPGAYVAVGCEIEPNLITVGDRGPRESSEGASEAADLVQEDEV